MQTANFKLCLEIFSVFPAAARNQEWGGRGWKKKKNPNKNSVSLFSATHFSAPVKQNASCKPGGRHKVKREELLLCSAASFSFSFQGLHAPFFSLSFITSHVIPALSFPSCDLLPNLNFSGPSFTLLHVQFILWVSSEASCCALSLTRAKSGNIPPFPRLGWNYWFSNCWDSVGLLQHFPRYVPAVTDCLAENTQGWPQKQISQRTICFNFSWGISLDCESLHAFGLVTHLSNPPKSKQHFLLPLSSPIFTHTEVIAISTPSSCLYTDFMFRIQTQFSIVIFPIF